MVQAPLHIICEFGHAIYLTDHSAFHPRTLVVLVRSGTVREYLAGLIQLIEATCN